MKKNKKTIVCLDLGTDSIKFLSGSISSDTKLIIKDFQIIKYPAGAYEKQDFKVILENLSKLLTEKKIKENCLICISNSKDLMQVLNIPFMPKEEIANAVKWELTQKKQFDVSKTYWDFICNPITYDLENKEKKIFISSYNKDNIDELLSICNSKIKLEGIENANFSLINGLNKLKFFPSNKPYVILNLSASYSYVLIAQSGRLIFERRLNTGGFSITKSISSYCKINLENAEQIKNEYGFISDSDNEQIISAKNIMTSSLEKLVSDIQYSLKYFSFQVTKSKITSYEKVLLTGGGAKLKGLKEFLMERLSMNCSIIDFEDKVKLPTNHDYKDEKEAWPIISSAIGLFFWDSEDRNERCSSLIPTLNERESSSFIGKTKKILSDYLAFVVLFAFMFWIAESQTLKMNSQIKNLNDEIFFAEQVLKEEEVKFKDINNNIKELNEENGMLQARIKNAKEKLNSINRYKSSTAHYAKAVKLLSKITPASLYIAKIEMNHDYIVISGISKTHEKIVELMKSINDSDFFNNCNFVYAKNTEKSDLIEFEVKAEVFKE